MKNELCKKYTYIIGVPEEEYIQYISEESFCEFEKDKVLKNIRTLNMLKNDIINNFAKCEYDGKYNLLNIERWNYIDQKTVRYIFNEIGRLNVIKFMPLDYITEIEKMIKKQFEYMDDEYALNEYIYKSMVTDECSQNSKFVYFLKNRKYKYPFGIYINNSYSKALINLITMLYNDENFVTGIKELIDGNKEKQIAHNKFETHRKPIAAVENFMSEKTVIIADCENFKYEYAVKLIKNIDYNRENIEDIYLIEGTNMKDALKWNEIEDTTVINTNRIIKSKSLVDFELLAKVYDSFYNKGIKKFIILSSDSDYYTLFSLKGAEFCFVVDETVTNINFITEIDKKAEFTIINDIKMEIKKRTMAA